MAETLTAVFEQNWTIEATDTPTEKLRLFKTAIRAVTTALDNKINDLEQQLRDKDERIAELEGKKNDNSHLKEFSIKQTTQAEVSRVRDNLIVTSSVKSKLEERLQKVVNAQSEWGNLAIEVSKIDRKFGFSASKGNFEHGGASLLSKKEIKTFYGEEPGHKWQDPYEWFAEVERQICRFTNDEEVKVYVVLSHLSPNICRLAKVQNFKTYEELKMKMVVAMAISGVNVHMQLDGVSTQKQF